MLVSSSGVAWLNSGGCTPAIHHLVLENAKPKLLSGCPTSLGTSIHSNLFSYPVCLPLGALSLLHKIVFNTQGTQELVLIPIVAYQIKVTICREQKTIRSLLILQIILNSCEEYFLQCSKKHIWEDSHSTNRFLFLLKTFRLLSKMLSQLLSLESTVVVSHEF